MLQNPRKTLGFKKNMVYKIPPGGGGKPYPASGLLGLRRCPMRILGTIENRNRRRGSNFLNYQIIRYISNL